MTNGKIYLIALATILFFGCSGRQDKPPVGDIFDEANLSAAENNMMYLKLL